MNSIRLIFSKQYWRNYFSIWGLIYSLLASYGILFTLIKLIKLFNRDIDNYLDNNYLWFIFLGILISYTNSKPKFKISRKLKGRDISIEIVVSDLFKMKGDKIIGCNTTFDTAIPTIISPKSIQGQFTEKNFNSVDHLNNDIDKSLFNEPYLNISKTIGKTKKYDIGTVAKVIVGDETNYLVAIADISEKGVASTTNEKLTLSLSKLWYFISTNGSTEPIIIPILGSGFSRLTASREELIIEIIKSFIASCSESKFTEKLKICIHPNDFFKKNIDLNKLEKYLDHVCNYTSYGNSSSSLANGTAI